MNIHSGISLIYLCSRPGLALMDYIHSYQLAWFDGIPLLRSIAYRHATIHREQGATIAIMEWLLLCMQGAWITNKNPCYIHVSWPEFSNLSYDWLVAQPLYCQPIIIQVWVFLFNNMDCTMGIFKKKSRTQNHVSKIQMREGASKFSQTKIHVIQWYKGTDK